MAQNFLNAETSLLTGSINSKMLTILVISSDMGKKDKAQIFMILSREKSLENVKIIA